MKICSQEQGQVHEASKTISNLLPCDGIDESPPNSLRGFLRGIFMTGNHWQQKQPQVHLFSPFVLFDSMLATWHFLDQYFNGKHKWVATDSNYVVVLIKFLAIQEVVIHWDVFKESMLTYSSAEHAERNDRPNKCAHSVVNSWDLQAQLLLPKSPRTEILQMLSCFNKWKVLENARRECAYLGLLMQNFSIPSMNPVQVWSKE